MSTQVDLDFVLGRTVALEAQAERSDSRHEKSERRLDVVERHLASIDGKLVPLAKIERSLEMVSGQLGSVGKAVGLRDFAPLPDDWEDITQVKRPKLRKLEEERAHYEKKSRTRPLAAVGGSAVVMLIIEIVQRYLEGHIQFH